MEKAYTRLYVIGFVLSLILTLAAYFVVVGKIVTGAALAITVGALAIAQFIVQVLFFLRLHQEKKPHWKLTVFFFMLLVLVVIIFGTLWIMLSLNYNLMTNTNGY